MKRRDFIQLTSTAAVAQVLPKNLFAQPTGEPPFLGSWLHLTHLFRNLNSTTERQLAVDAALDGHLSAGLRTVMPYVTDTAGGAHFPSRIINQRSGSDWDPLEYLTKNAKKLGLAVYPAFSTLVCGHQKPAGVLLKHAEWASLHPNGKPMGHISPTNPHARNWVTSVIADVVKRYPIDGIMLDYLRYYNRPSRLDASSEKEFIAWKKKQSGISDKEALQVYRESGITKLARQISETVRVLKPGLKIAIYSWGPHVTNNHLVAQPWTVWSRDRLIDQVSISGYCYPDNYGKKYLDVFSRRIGDALKLNRSSGGRAQVTFTLGVSTSHGKIRDVSWINEYLTRAAGLGVAGVAVFTWAYLQPYLKEVIRSGYFPAFKKQISV